MRAMKRLLAIAAPALLFFACSSSNDVPPGHHDDRHTHDAATPDAAAAGDAGAGNPDAAPILDAGSDTTPDAGQTGGPIEAEARTWTWVDVPDSRCMNDTPTGFAVNIEPSSTRLIIYMAGGNACFNRLSCSVTYNRDGYDAVKFGRESQGLSVGIFDRDAPENAFQNDSYVYIPYCSGDVYAGTVGTTTVEGATWTFKGWNNIGLFMERIVATFPQVTEVVLSGSSAGGFGATLNFDRTQRAFGDNARVTLVNDSAPPMGSEYLATCLQSHWRTLWGYDAGMLSLCEGCADQTGDGGFIEPYLSYLLERYPNNPMMLISSETDDVIRSFWGFGTEDCRYLIGTPGIPSYAGSRYREGLYDLRDRLLAGHDNFRVFYLPGSRHVWLNTPPWQVESDGVALSTWLEDALAGREGWGNVPAPARP